MISRRFLIVLIILLLAGFIMSGIAYPFLPNPAPIHWNWRGQADGYGSPLLNAFLLPFASVFITAVAILVPRLARRELPAGFSRIYGRMVVMIAAVFIGVQAVLLLQTMGVRVWVGRLLPMIFGVLLAVLGNWFGEIRRNPYVGIRTPWTLANDEVWERTHRVGGRLFVTFGLGAAVAGMIAPPWAGLTILLAVTVGLVIWAMVYSRQLYHQIVRLDVPK